MIDLEQARKVAGHLISAIDPFCIVVFGSVATKGKGNDLDLLIVTEDSAQDLRYLRARIHHLLRPFSRQFAIDPFVANRSEVQTSLCRGSPFLRLIQRTGRCLYMKESVKIWMHQADEELKTARYLLEGNYYRSACYHAQQATEKAIKGALIQKGWELEKIHNIERLVAIGEEFGIDPGLPEDEQILIDSIYRGRYPAEEGLLPTGEPTKSETHRIVGIATTVLQRLFKK